MSSLTVRSCRPAYAPTPRDCSKPALDSAHCQKGKVSIFRSQSGADPKVAKGKAKGGKYTAAEDDPESGKYYAKLKQKQANEITCLKAKSKKTKVG